MDTWHDMGHMSNLSELDKKGLKNHFLGINTRFLLSGGEREGKKKKRKNPNFSLRSTEFCRLEFVRPRMKVHILDEGYAWVSKTRDFIEDSSKEFGKSKVSGLGSVHGTS